MEGEKLEPGVSARPHSTFGGVTGEDSKARDRKQRKSKLSIIAVVHHEDGEVEIPLAGRPAWCVMQLVAAGADGCTTLSNPAPRWSAYVADCREAGIPIVTVYERHGGPFEGNHGRYKLAARVTIKPAEVAP